MLFVFTFMIICVLEIKTLKALQLTKPAIVCGRVGKISGVLVYQREAAPYPGKGSDPHEYVWTRKVDKSFRGKRSAETLLQAMICEKSGVHSRGFIPRQRGVCGMDTCFRGFNVLNGTAIIFQWDICMNGFEVWNEGREK